jgi:protein-S-isoprenylcysteine O-methyltransferase Ste14
LPEIGLPGMGSSLRTFVVIPIVVLGWEFFLGNGTIRFEPWFLPLLAWGYLQYKLVGRYRLSLGGGGPGMKTMPERLVTGGPYAYTRNPMYLGHILFLVGLALTLHSELGATIAVASAVFFHVRVTRDEQRLREFFGEPYAEYCARVKRWIPRLF